MNAKDIFGFRTPVLHLGYVARRSGGLNIIWDRPGCLMGIESSTQGRFVPLFQKRGSFAAGTEYAIF